MTFTEQLKEQLIDFVESYRKYFLKTFAVAMIFTVLCFVASVIPIWFNTSSSGVSFSGLLDLLFYRSSYKSYSWVDLGPLFSYFFVAIFSLALFRYNEDENEDLKELTFSRFIKTIYPEDTFALLAILAVAWSVDFLLFKFSVLFQNTSVSMQEYIRNLVFHLRLFAPLMLFAVGIHWLTNKKQLNITLKELLYLFLTIWLFNQFALGAYLWIKYNILALLLLLAAQSDLLPLYQTILSIPIMGFYFVGYYSALTWWLRTGNEYILPDNPEIAMPSIKEDYPGADDVE